MLWSFCCKGTAPIVRDVDAAARANSMEIKVFKASNSREVNAEFEAIAQEQFDGVFVERSPFSQFTARPARAIGSSPQHSRGVLGREFPEVGGLISYGSDIAEAYRQIGIYCGRILKGAKPAELPVVQSSKLRASHERRNRAYVEVTGTAAIGRPRRRGDRMRRREFIAAVQWPRSKDNGV